jgi:hypothetical protein
MSDDKILWVSPHCFIMNGAVWSCCDQLSCERRCSLHLFAKQVYFLSFSGKFCQRCHIKIYCAADTNNTNIHNEISQVLEAFLLWIGTFELERVHVGKHVRIEGVRHPTTHSLPNISLTAESLNPFQSVRLESLVINEGSCRAIHNADLERLTLFDVSVPNVAALQLNVGGPRELCFELIGLDHMPEQYVEMLDSLTEGSNVRSLSFQGGPNDFTSRVLLPVLQAYKLAEFTVYDCEISMDEWRLLWETIGASKLRTVHIGGNFGLEIEDEAMEAMRIVADVMRSNRSIVRLDFYPFDCDEDVCKSTIHQYVQRNILLSNLDKLASEPDKELRAALVGHLLQSNFDNSDAIFQILTQNTDAVVAYSRQKYDLQPDQDQTEQPNRRGRKRRARP